MKGKNFSGVNLGQRKKSDFYETPYSMTQQFLDLKLFNVTSRTLEPACGNGAIVSVLKANGFNDVVSYDIEANFLIESIKYEQIVTNPPFSLAYEFILKAKEVSERFAMLLPLSYLHGKKRYDGIYSDNSFALQSVNVFCRYPMLGEKLRCDGKYKTGMMVYAWFVWDKTHSGSAAINWIDNQEYVLTSKQGII